MKHLQNFELFEGGDPEKKADMREKIRDLDKKDRELVVKKSEAAKKLTNEEDPLKAEVISLSLQKLELQKLMARIDKKITLRKLQIEDRK